MFMMRTEFLVVIVQVLVVLSHISTVKAGSKLILCDNYRNVLKCNDGASTVICINSISTGQSEIYICSSVSRPILPNINCHEDVVKSYILAKCNGKKRECEPFYRNTEISESCDGAFKYVQLQYTCVSSLSKCSTLDEMLNNKPLPPHLNVMASRTNVSAGISPTETAKTLAINEINEQKNSTLRLGEIPATTALEPLEPGNETKHNFSTSLPGPTSRAPNSRKKFKTCTRKTTSATTVSPKQENNIPSIKPPHGGRNAGHSVFDIGFPLKFYVMIVSGFFGFSLP